MPDHLMSLAERIVSAHVANNAVRPEDLPRLIENVHRALAEADKPVAHVHETEPAVPIRKSVLPDRIICLDCGEPFSMLKRHLSTDHQLSLEHYRQKWGLPSAYPFVAPDYAKRRSAIAKKAGLGRLPAAARRKKRVAA